ACDQMRAKAGEDLLSQRGRGIRAASDQALPDALVEARQRQAGAIAVEAVERAEVVADEPGVRARSGISRARWVALLVNQRGRVKAAGDNSSRSGGRSYSLLDAGAHHHFARQRTVAPYFVRIGGGAERRTIGTDACEKAAPVADARTRLEQPVP